jgi:hypothetical protein
MTILEVLQEANGNLSDDQFRATGVEQVHTVVRLLEKGYSLDDQIEPLTDWKYRSVEEVPEKGGGEMKAEAAYKEMRCGNCKYWAGSDFAVNASGHEMRFDCRRYPPILRRGKKQWPQTTRNQWCGEWRAREYKEE